MVFVLGAALHVHIAGVPVAIFSGGLRAPMRPDAELGVPEPLGNLVRPQRFAGSFELGIGLGRAGATTLPASKPRASLLVSSCVRAKASLFAREARRRPDSRFSANL